MKKQTMNRAKKILITCCVSLSSIAMSYQLDLYKSTNLSDQELTKILNLIAGEEKDCCWVPEYPIVAQLINEMGLKVGCEIGVAYGGQSKYLLENTALEKLYSIDPYRKISSDYPYPYLDFFNLGQHVHDVQFLKVKYLLEEFGDRSILVRKTSQEAVKNFDNNSLDFVYIDANHAYEYVLQDLDMWFPKVRSGGLIAGDDYVVWHSSVAPALKNFTQKHSITYRVQGNKWWFIKP